MADDTQAVQVLPPFNPMQLIDKALSSGIDENRLGKLMELAKEWSAEQALRAYNQAMNACQLEMKAVLKARENKATNSKYAALEDIDDAIKPIYTMHGFSLSYGSGESKLEKHVRIICDVLHIGGHVRQYIGDFPLDDSGLKGNANKTGIQATGSTYSYGRRYLKVLIFDVTIRGEDNDGNGVRVCLGSQHIKTINDLIVKCGLDGDTDYFNRFLRWLGGDSLENIPITQYGLAIDHLQRELKKKTAKKEDAK